MTEDRLPNSDPSMNPFAAADAPPAHAEFPAVGLALPSGLIDGGEIVLMAIKPSMWQPLLTSAPWWVTSLALAIAVSVLGSPLPGISLVMTVQLIMLVGVARFGLALIRWVPRWHILTNRRVIDIRGVRRPRVSALLLVNIRNTYLTSDSVDRVLNLGSITMVTERENDTPRIWRWVAQPDLVHDKIRRAIRDAMDN